ncbi:MAG: long-chain fatty acid--CoA ligase [Bacteroidales bacterium]|jgi:long-chain acyl-CoA synthetase|nr:long-chain fatty acid--CoA ligase [Bacteroidales bacterium]
MEVKRVFDILDLYDSDYSEIKDAFSYKDKGSWVNFSAYDYYKYSYLFACGLINKGYNKGDKIITISQSLPHWNIADMGISLAGLIHVPIYTTLGPQELEYIIRHSDARAIFVSDGNLYRKIKPIADKIENIEKIYTFHHISGIENWGAIIQEAYEKESELMPQLEAIKESINENDIHTIIYTSGTTGDSKGVMLSHKNILTNAIALKPVLPIEYGHRILSFLPLCHVYERTLNYAFQLKGTSIYYAESLGTITNDCQEINPRLFNTVPRVLEKFYDKIISMGKDLHGIKRWIFFWAVRLGVKFDEIGNNSAYYNLKLKVARKLVFNKWKRVFGTNIHTVVSGGASLQVRLAKLFTAAGISICEGYGLSETSPVIAVNWPGWTDRMLGTVGPILKDVEVKIADDGEILAKGPTIMLGYYKNPEGTKAVIDEDNWFHTGDIGELVDGKYLRITDRKKEIFKTSSGKYIAPQVIENKFKSSALIEQLMIVGENEKFVSALISPNFNHLHFFASKHKIHYRDNAELIKNPEIIKKIQKEIDAVNVALGEHEKIKRFRLVCEEWSQPTGELSPTLKLRRNVIYKKYDNVLQEIYGHGTDKTENMGKEISVGDSIEKRITNGMRKLINIRSGKNE